MNLKAAYYAMLLAMPGQPLPVSLAKDPYTRLYPPIEPYDTGGAMGRSVDAAPARIS